MHIYHPTNVLLTNMRHAHNLMKHNLKLH